MDTGSSRAAGLLVSAVFTLWVLRCLRPVWWSHEGNLARAVAGLSAGIVFVDWLAVADAPRQVGVIFVALFGITLLFQRLAEAT
jgi:hypothetical protein